MSSDIAKKIKKYLEYQGAMGLKDFPMSKEKMKPKSKKSKKESICNSNISLEDVSKEIGNCTRCPLSKDRNNIVFGVGSSVADIMFVGEGPGAEEDKQGLPFVGRAGQLLTKIIEAMGQKRDDVYIANIVKCRPPGNRNPLPNEVSTCVPFLRKQIESIKPKVIICLGSVAIQNLLQTDRKISEMRGNFEEYMGVKVMPTFHPAYLLRNPSAKHFVWDDMKKVMAELKEK